ncbi:hypothetical protein TKK_0017591 [Trichogramma kaykai]
MQNIRIKSSNSTSNEPEDAKSKKNNQLGKKLTSSVLKKNSVESDIVNSDLSEIEETEMTTSTKVNAHNPKTNEKLSSNLNLHHDTESLEHDEEIHDSHVNELKPNNSDYLEDDHTITVHKNKEVEPSNKITEIPIKNTPKKTGNRKRAASTDLSCLDDDEEDDAFQGIGSSNSHSRNTLQLQGSHNQLKKDGAVWSKETIRNGKLCNMKMVHLGRGISIPLHNWEIVLKKAKTRSLFIKNLARNLYGCERLANRCVSGTQKCTKVTNRDSPRKPFTPKKIKVIKNCYKAFLTNIKPSFFKKNEDLLVVLDEFNSVLSDEISVQIKEYKKSQAQNIKLKKPLRLEEVYDDEEINDSLDEDEMIYEEE